MKKKIVYIIAFLAFFGLATASLGYKYIQVSSHETKLTDTLAKYDSYTYSIKEHDTAVYVIEYKGSVAYDTTGGFTINYLSPNGVLVHTENVRLSTPYDSIYTQKVNGLDLLSHYPQANRIQIVSKYTLTGPTKFQSYLLTWSK